MPTILSQKQQVTPLVAIESKYMAKKTLDKWLK